MFKKLILLVTGVMMCMTLAGCAGEVYEKSYLQTFYVSGGINGEITANMRFYDDTPDIIESGRSLGEIIRKAEMRCGKAVVTGHTEIIVLNGCDIRETLVFMLRERKVPPSCYAVIGDGDIENFGNVSKYQIIEHAIEKDEIPECGLITVLSSLLNKGMAETVRFDEEGFGRCTIKD